jgi:glycosyltransferase involved in cell wall biosynthesis
MINNLIPAPSQKYIIFVGGEDVRMRIPFLIALQQLGYRVAAMGSEDSSIFEQHDIPYFRYALNRWLDPFADIKSYVQMLKLFKAHQPDIVHAFDTKPAIIAPIAARHAGIGLRFRTITGMGYVFSSDSLLANLLKPVYRSAQRIASTASVSTIFQNTDDFEYFKRYSMVGNGNSAIVTGSGLDIAGYEAKLTGIKKQTDIKESLGLRRKNMVLMVARLVKDKGVLQYLEAARRIQQCRDDIDFVLVGPLSSEGKQAISPSIIRSYSHEVHYLGERKDVPELLSAANCFVLPSYYREGVPRVLLEAGYMGVPLVTTDMPGCREVVKNGWNGWLIPPRQVRPLADAIIKTIDMEELDRITFGLRSKEFIKNEFSLEYVLKAYTDIYADSAAVKYIN